MRRWYPSPSFLKKFSTSSSTRIEIACFFGGMTKTASDQSISRGTASGSFATAWVISSSVSASTAAQSVLPFVGEYRETIVIFSSLVSARRPCRDDPEERAAERAGDRDLPPLD